LPDTVAGVTRPLPGSDDELIPRYIRVSAALSWRLAVIIAALYALVWMIGYLSVLVIPVAVAVLLSALLVPAVERLTRIGAPRWLATVAVLIGGLAALGGVFTFVIIQFSNGLPQLQANVNESLDTIQDWLLHGPLHLRQEQLQEFTTKIVTTIKENQAAITSGALTTAATVGEVLTGFLLTLFALIFFLHDGDNMWRFTIRAIPVQVRPRMDLAGRRAFASLVSYVRATAAVAVVDAVGIGVGLAIVGVPLAVPLAALVFLSAFVPIVGAVLAGTVAVLVALVANGFTAALIVAAIVIAVMQLESHVLQPILLGRAVKLHPLAVVLAITAGIVSSGIAGGVLAVPLLAVLNSGLRSLLETPQPPAEEPEPVTEPVAETPEPAAAEPVPDK
jgi:predicted PurR-regulated permease PerM